MSAAGEATGATAGRKIAAGFLFGQILRFSREIVGLSQKQMAEHLGCSQSLLSRMEGGTSRVSILKIAIWSERVGCSQVVLWRLYEALEAELKSAGWEITF